MTAPTNQPATDEELARFAAYNDEHPAWGSLHIVLEDDNVRDSDVEFCRDYAIEHDDQEGYELAVILLRLSKSQRLNLPSRVAYFRIKGRAAS